MADISTSKNRPIPIPSRQLRERLLTEQLKSVSRSFYLTLRILPFTLREPVSLAYLLARAADTITDSKVLTSDSRLHLLHDYQAQISGPASLQVLEQIVSRALSLEEFVSWRRREVKSNFTDENTLLMALPELFGILESLPIIDQQLVREVVTTLTKGMEFDLTTFPSQNSSAVTGVATSSDLDHYTYLVAGSAGLFWTKISAAHVKSLVYWDIKRMSDLGVRFGKALQMTNILRDVSEDFGIGRCYLPTEILSRYGLSPTEIMDTQVSEKVKAVLTALLELALSHYGAATEYLFAIPRRSWRLRLAALWPILIGLSTLNLLAGNEGWPESSNHLKIPRRWIYRMMVLSFPAVLSNTLLKWWISDLSGNVQRSLR